MRPGVDVARVVGDGRQRPLPLPLRRVERELFDRELPAAAGGFGIKRPEGDRPGGVVVVAGIGTGQR